MNLLSEEYKFCSSFILYRYNKGQTWDDIKNFKTTNSNDLKDAFENFKASNCIDITLDEWYEIFEHVKSDKEAEVDIKIVPASMIPSSAGYDYKLNNMQGSAWNSYKTKLFKKGLKTEVINSIEDSAHKILNKLSLNTTGQPAIKGLVVGNVQSGKTSNMAALIAMGADLGFNLFIVLSGSIENLRIQTQDRLINDLNGATNVSWIPINNVSTATTYVYALSKLELSENSRHRYLMVCLKNSSRLDNLLNWLNKDEKSRKLLKILVIDDEADQAGINATQKEIEKNGKIERTKINQAIVSLINNKDSDGSEAKANIKAINYVAYTATPYANILNEKPGINSIYPSNFVASLSVSNEYFGPQQIFGLSAENLDGMTIINEVTSYTSVKNKDAEDKKNEPSDLELLKLIYKKESNRLPQSLKDAILWFYCGLATMRLWKINKPFSMLIHTSQKQDHHQIIADLIKVWFKKFDGISFIKECERVYKEQTKKFTIDDFWASYPNYGNKDVKNYLDFKEIANELANLFTNGLSYILIDDKNDPQYSKGVHLCIDNCHHNYLGDNQEHIRLLYPTTKLDYATGFIVIGGATLSRGLTIEGLISTYFVRTVKQADSLMQMGRWFGYRKSYELFPRIWMSNDTLKKFEFLSLMDFELRNKMKQMEEYNISPEKCGIRILKYANSKLILTSKNKSKAAKTLEKGFDNFEMQNTMFFRNEKILKDNYDATINFVDSIEVKPEIKDSKILWRNVEHKDVINYIKSLNFPNMESFNLKLFDDWFEKNRSDGKLENWNVAISGSSKYKDTIPFGKYQIYLTNRSRKSDDKDGIIRIGVLRSPADLCIDVNDSLISQNEKTKIIALYQEIRKKSGLGNTPLLVIYVIDSKSKAANKNRFDMNTENHLIGLMVLIPGNDEDEKEYQDYIGIPLFDDEDEES